MTFTVMNLPFPFNMALFARVLALLLDRVGWRNAPLETDLPPVPVGVAELHQLLELGPHLVGDCSPMESALIDLGMPMPQELYL
jgi:hypothetical protein